MSKMQRKKKGRRKKRKHQPTEPRKPRKVLTVREIERKTRRQKHQHQMYRGTPSHLKKTTSQPKANFARAFRENPVSTALWLLFIGYIVGGLFTDLYRQKTITKTLIQRLCRGEQTVGPILGTQVSQAKYNELRAYSWPCDTIISITNTRPPDGTSNRSSYFIILDPPGEIYKATLQYHGLFGFSKPQLKRIWIMPKKSL